MNRMLSAILAVGAILAMTSFSAGDAMAQETLMVAPKVVIGRTAEPQVTETRGGPKVLALVMALRAVQSQHVRR